MVIILFFLEGLVLADVLRKYMNDMGINDGLESLGFTSSDIPSLVKGTLPQVCDHIHDFSV